MDFYETVGSTVLHHDFHTASLHPFWTDEIRSVKGGPRDAVLDLRSYAIVDDVSIVNPDGSETFVASHPATIDVRVEFKKGKGDPVSIAGMTEPTLVDGVIPEPTTPEPFSGLMFLDEAKGDFRATAWNADGSLYRSFKTKSVKSGFAELGTETVGSP